jgi:hypothetical protein
VSAKLLTQLLWHPLPDTLPAFGWWAFPPPDEPSAALATDSAAESEQDPTDRRVRRDAVQALVRNAYLATLAEQDSEHRPPASFARAWRARFTALLAQPSVDPSGPAAMTISGSDLDLAWRVYELACRARRNAIESATASPSRRVQLGRQVPTFEFSIVSGTDPLGDVMYGICRSCSTGVLYTIEFAPDWQFCGLGRLALSQLEARHPDLTWYTTGQFLEAKGFYDQYRQDSASPWTDEQHPCPHLE